MILWNRMINEIWYGNNNIYIINLYYNNTNKNELYI